MDNGPPMQVAAGLILHKGRFLITRRKPGVHLGGLWEFPGGKREPDESLEDCLRRELREELGIEVTTPVPFEVIRHEYPEETVELHFFRCALESGSAEARGCDDLCWVTPAQLSGYDFPSADRPLIERLQRLQMQP